MENNVTDLPEGFVLDKPTTASTDLPEGFVLDKPKEEEGFTDAVLDAFDPVVDAVSTVGSIGRGVFRSYGICSQEQDR